MESFFSTETVAWAAFVAPAVLLAMLALSLTAKGLRGSPGAAFLAFLAGVGLVLASGAGVVAGVNSYLQRVVIPDCEAMQRAAHERGETLLLDCESEGLFVVFPVAGVGIALFLVLVGAVVIRVTAKR